MELNEIMLRDLRNTISNIVREELQRYLITEMAVSLKDYRKNIESLMQQIIENWCLELKAHMNNIAAMKLKDGNKITTKQNTIFDIWNKYDLDSDENCIALRIATKFEMENIDTVGDFFAQVVSDFKNETTKLVKILTTGNNYSIKEYVENI